MSRTLFNYSKLSASYRGAMALIVKDLGYLAIAISLLEMVMAPSEYSQAS